jgi:ribosome-associated translation inhibitor RaiA/cold shock CspA family protein
MRSSSQRGREHGPGRGATDKAGPVRCAAVGAHAAGRKRVRPIPNPEFPMKQPLQLRFLGMEPSDAVAAAARDKAAKLDQFHPDLMSCRVTIERVDKHQHQGQHFAVRIDVTLPGEELSVDRVQNEDAYVALRDAFDDMRRRIQDSHRRVQRHVKEHAASLHGKLVRIDVAEKRGFIESSEGDDYWFGPDNVTGTPFEHLEVGTEVQFIGEVAGEGRQAKRVSVGKHHFG